VKIYLQKKKNKDFLSFTGSGSKKKEITNKAGSVNILSVEMEES
jgi:hypothetical protein